MSWVSTVFWGAPDCVEIPVHIVEEHHECFVVFNLCRSQYSQSERRFVFVHFDEHSDLGFPCLSSPVPHLDAPLNEIVDFAYDQLAIGNFVYPLIFQGRIGRFIWVRPDDVPLEPSTRVAHLFSRHHNRRDLCVTNDIAVAGALNWTRKSAQIDATSLGAGLSIAPGFPIFVDIDLDYFSCDAVAGGGWQVEITKTAFDDFRHNKFNSARLLHGGARARVTERDGRFWFSVDEPFRASLPARSRRQDQFRAAIDQVVHWIVQHRSRIEGISICRSARSGFTPPDQVDAILEQLLARLRTELSVSVAVADWSWKGVLRGEIVASSRSLGREMTFSSCTPSGPGRGKRDRIAEYSAFIAVDDALQLRLQGDTRFEFLSEAAKIAASNGYSMTLDQLSRAVEEQTVAANRHFDMVYYNALF